MSAKKKSGFRDYILMNDCKGRIKLVRWKPAKFYKELHSSPLSNDNKWILITYNSVARVNNGFGILTP